MKIIQSSDLTIVNQLNQQINVMCTMDTCKILQILETGEDEFNTKTRECFSKFWQFHDLHMLSLVLRTRRLANRTKAERCFGTHYYDLISFSTV